MGGEWPGSPTDPNHPWKVKENDLNQSSMCKMWTTWGLFFNVFLHSWEVNKMCVVFKALFSTSWHSFEPCGAFKYFLFPPLPGEDYHFDEYFSIGLNHQLDKQRGPSDWFSNVIPCHTGSWQIRQGMVGPLPQQEQPCTTEAPAKRGRCRVLWDEQWPKPLLFAVYKYPGIEGL